MSHPGIDAITALLADSGLSEATIPEQRAAMEAVAGMPPPAGVTATAGKLGGRPAEWLDPDDVASPRASVVLYLHGGGYCIGSLATHRNLGGLLALALGATVVTLDYRLAPEHPFPAAVDDALAAYRELLDLGHEPASIAIAGDSAGGGLTVATLVAARDAGLPLPAAAACLSPWVDLSQTAASFTEIGDADPMVTRAGLDLMAEAYLAGADPATPGASPLHADLAGLPPLRIEVGEVEVLRDDALSLAEAARAAGVAVDLVRWPDLVHVFQAFPAELVPEAADSIAGIAAFLRAHLA